MTTRVPVAGATLGADLALPEDPVGLVVFAHGSGSSRHSPRNRAVAGGLNERGLGTLLLDLLAAGEEHDRRNVFDIELITGRLRAATAWVAAQPHLADLPVGYFGASTGAAAALEASIGSGVAAIVSRGGRTDLAPAAGQVTAPTLLIVGGADEVVLRLNEETLGRLAGPAELLVVPGAGHLFSEPGALEQVTAAAGDWFGAHLGAAGAAR